MKIAICDDEYADAKLISNYCNQYAADIPALIFTCGEALLRAYQSDYFDLVFLDIELGKMSGLEVGRRLAAMPQRPLVVFTTQSLNYSLHGYGIAMRYLVKPITYDVFSNAIRPALERLMPKKISIFVSGEQILLPINRILYFEVLSHKLFVHLNNGETISTRATLNEIMEQIPNGCFSQPHKSYYVNMEYVDRVAPQNLMMTNGDFIPIGRSKKDNFQFRLSEYIRGSHQYEYLD